MEYLTCLFRHQVFLYFTRNQELTLEFFTPLREYTRNILRGEVQCIANEGDREVEHPEKCESTPPKPTL